MSNASRFQTVQRNVVHVIGLTTNVAKAEVLKCPEYFGQYGKLLRVTVSKLPVQSKSHNGEKSIPVYSAYLTFEKPEEASVAIQAVDGFAVDGHTLRANFGTTKYCRKFLEGERCERKDCNFLHKLADESNEKGNWKGGKDGRDGKGGKDGKCHGLGDSWTAGYSSWNGKESYQKAEWAEDCHQTAASFTGRIDLLFSGWEGEGQQGKGLQRQVGATGTTTETGGKTRPGLAGPPASVAANMSWTCQGHRKDGGKGRWKDWGKEGKHGKDFKAGNCWSLGDTLALDCVYEQGRGKSSKEWWNGWYQHDWGGLAGSRWSRTGADAGYGNYGDEPEATYTRMHRHFAASAMQGPSSSRS
ncbi:Cnot4 [Symbiodinium sp. CCMP2592]|nr:Cnot4 [Symbiodinium sp. CCMP2592]